MMFHRIIIAALVVAIPRSSCLEPSDLVVVVLSQQECYYANLANSLKNGVIKEAEKLDKVPPEVVLTHELSINGSWTIFPLLSWLRVNFSTSKWFFFCLESTGVSLANLVQVLSALDDREEMWVGHAIHDHAPTIIHHFADHSERFMFPNIASGFAMTNPLLVRTSERFASVGGPGQDFSIDAAYEFANFVFDGGKGVGLTHVSEFCLSASWDCASYPRFFNPCSEPVSRDKIFVAVKTSRQYHKDRVPIIMKTWMKHVLHYGLFSNESDESLPNIHITPHTVQGHCAKTHTILQAAHEILEEKKMDWLIIVDDDTILSMARLTRLLTCYNPSDLIGLGERYGFRVRNSTSIGYDYLTGGAGIVVSKALVKKIIETRACDCPSPTAPDDMYLFGYCLRVIGVQPVHSPAFHQARPLDYSIVYLASHECVSFHKFWMIDPYKVYNSWFAEDDDALSPSKNILHTEL